MNKLNTTIKTNWGIEEIKERMEGLVKSFCEEYDFEDYTQVHDAEAWAEQEFKIGAYTIVCTLRMFSRIDISIEADVQLVDYLDKINYIYELIFS